MGSLYRRCQQGVAGSADAWSLPAAGTYAIALRLLTHEMPRPP